MNPLDRLVNALNANVTQETAADFNLTLTHSQFETRMLNESDGLELLQLLEFVGMQCEQLGLLRSYKRGGQWHVDVSSWFKLVSHLHSLHNLYMQKCAEKTARGNVYPNEEVAQRQAKKMAAKYMQNIVAFKCQICPHYHLGKAH